MTGLIIWYNIKVNEMSGKGLNNCMFPGWGPSADFLLGLWISGNSIGNVNTAKRNNSAENNLLADESPHHWNR